MTKLLLTALKVLLVLILLTAIGIGAVLLADYKGWSRLFAIAVVAGLFCLIVLMLLLRRYYFRRREAKFVKRVVDQDSKAIDAAPAHERRALTELQKKWSSAVAALRASRLNRRGDPLYQLPWYMIFGETGSGKSTAVSHARLRNILTDAGPAKGIASTRNCDWWFFENAVILDSAGRYAVPLADEDKGEWERFLTLLAKYRRKEPLNGLIVTLPADRLLAGDTDAMTEYGRSIRLRIDQLMRVLGAKFPVYLLITKIDLILGMTAMAEILPEKLRGQAMGLLNENEAGDPGEFLATSLAHVSRRLKELRLRLAARIGRTGGRAVLFPDEFERLAPGIRAFVDGAFFENPYQETPFFRGFFISSGRQSGLASSGVLGAMDSFKDRQWPLPDTGNGLFLHDFFDAVLPRDRAGFRPLGEYLSWRKATGNLALAVWLLLLIAGLGLGSVAYLQVRQVMQPAYNDFHKRPPLGGDIAQDMVALGLLRDRIAEMESQLSNRLAAAMGFTQGREAIAGLKEKYIQWFRMYILNPTDAAMKEKFVTNVPSDRKGEMAPYLEYLLWRVDTIRSEQQGNSKAPADTAVKDSPVEALALAFGSRLPYVTTFFTDMYRSYARWETDAGILRRERDEMQVWANRIMEMEGRNLHWLTVWADNRSSLADIFLDDFWEGSGEVAKAPWVSGAYTMKGRDAILHMIDQLSLVAEDREAFDKRVVDFRQWYANVYFEQWSNFALNFDRGMEKLMTRDEWENAGATMSTMDNPYFRLFHRMDEAFAAIRENRIHQDVNRLAQEFVYLGNSYKVKKGKATLQSKIAEKLKQIESRLERLDNSMAAAEAFTQYMQQLEAIVPVTASGNAAYHFAVQNFGNTSEDGKTSPVVLALTAINQMRSLIGQERDSEEALWRLMTGPLEFLVTLTTYEAACSINGLWQSQVVAETANTPPQALWKALFGEQGVVDPFVSGPAKPFLRRSRDGWTAGQWMGVTFPFEKHFLSFLDQGAVRQQQVQPKYDVSIATLPTDVNADAASEAYLTRLTLQCGDQRQTLENYNAPDVKDFTWEPAVCDDVSLTIYFEETSLTKTWAGQWGFRDFLRDFRDGRQVYSPAEFPKQQAALKRIGVRRIQVNYTIKNAAPILSLKKYPALRVPRQAAHCRAGLGNESWQPLSDSYTRGGAR